MVTMPSPPIEVGDELYLYHGGSRNHHDMWIDGLSEGLTIPEVMDMEKHVSYALGLAKVKKDRFVSLSALDIRPGAIVTKPFKTSGKKLILNAKVNSNGIILAQIADENDQPIPGYEKENCIPFTGDETSYRVTWKSKKTVPSDRIIKIHFYLKHADLFTFEFD